MLQAQARQPLNLWYAQCLSIRNYEQVQNDEEVHEVLKYAFHQGMQGNKIILIQGKQIY